MQIVVVAAFVIVMHFLATPSESWAAPPGVLFPAAAGYVAGAMAGADLAARSLLRRLMRGAPLGRRPMTCTLLAQAYLLGGLAGLMLAGWGLLPAQMLAGGRIPLVSEVLAIAPFALALAGHWWALFPLERALRDRLRMELALEGLPAMPVWTRRQYLWFNFRHHFLFVAAPASVIILLLDVLELIGSALPSAAAWGAGLAVGGAIFLAAPWIITRIWDTRPLPPGPLRDRLERFCRRAGLTYRDILVWNTSSVVVNAGVMGVIRPTRYVLLSDGMVGRMDADALEVILAHEAGHVVGGHIFYLVVFTAGVLSTCASLWQLLAGAMGYFGAWAEWPGLLAAVALWGWLFGIVSRRFERQSDVFAAWAAGQDSPAAVAAAGGLTGPACPAAARDALTPQAVDLFSQALMTVGRLNGIDPRGYNFRHGSIEQRLTYLADLCRSGRGRSFEERKIRRVKAGIWLILAVGVAATLAAASLAPPTRILS